MAKRLVKKILIEEKSSDTVKVYKRVWVEVPTPAEILPEPVVKEVELILTMSNTKAELLAEAERLGLNVNSGNTKAEILVAINAAQE